MKFNIQPTLENETVILHPLKAEDFEELYTTASDPKIWEQHPNKERWKKDVFKVFFEGALQSRGAFKLVNKDNGEVIGSTRFYDYNEQENSIHIGYTFYETRYWGKGINQSVKKTMLDYIFQFVPIVYFHVGAVNVRSQIAIGKLGATKIAEQEVVYFGEQPRLNYVYRLTKDQWQTKQE